MTFDTERPTASWPDGARAAAFFSFDMDGESLLLGADERNARLKVSMSQAAYGPKVGVFEILRRLAEYEVRATFFVPAWTALEHPRAVEAIVAGGHEVGLHGYLHEFPPALSRDEEVDVTGRSIEVLERLTGRRPTGYRAPGCETTEHTVPVLAEFAISYCSQSMDGVLPYFHRHENLPDVLELPWHWAMDDGGYGLLYPYMEPVPYLNAIVPNEHILQIWRAELAGVVQMGGLWTLINHPQITGRPGRLATLEAMLETATTDDRIWVACGEELDAHWRAVTAGSAVASTTA